MSIVRPTARQMTRRLIVLAAAVFAIAVPYVQMILGWGLSQAEFAGQGDRTLRVAGYAFAIWGVIYAALALFAVRQALPSTGESRILGAMGWPAAVSLVSIGVWILAAAADARLLTLVVIFMALIAILTPLLRHAREIRALGLGDRDRWMTVWPIALLAGWLSVAAPLNLLTVATANGEISAGAAGTTIAVIAIVLIALAALAAIWRIRSAAYCLPVAWGLFGAAVAETPTNAPVGVAAAVAAIAVLALGLGLCWRAGAAVERAPA